MSQAVDYALLFFAFSFLGWCMEVFLKYVQYHRFINRGFFTGPWLPIYGCGALAITVSVGDMSHFDSSYGTTFLISFFLCGAIEYLASWFMERRFHARWWDYSRKPMNLHGRVWIGNLVLFGLAGVLVVKVIDPVLFGLLDGIRLPVREIMAGFLLVLFAADYVITHFVLKLVKLGVEHSEADNTEEISREVRLLLSDRSYFYRRFADAYPEVIYRTERINARMAEIRCETERLRRLAEQRLEAGREQILSSLEPAALIKNTVIQNQDRLIDLMYDDALATEEMRALKGDIERDMKRLKSRQIVRPGGR